MPAACAVKIAAIDRYSADPAMLNVYPVGITKATILRGTPYASIASMERGNAASLVLVANAIVAGSATALRNSRSGSRASSSAGSIASSAKSAIEMYSVSASLPRFSITPSPDCATVYASAAATPTGAYSIT